MRRKENTTTETSRIQHTIGLSYISKLSEQVARIFKSYNIPVYHKPINTLRSFLVHPKDRTAKAANCGVLYDIQCPECDQHYIGETARKLGTRIKEHLSCRQPLSAISEHKLNTGHQCSMNDVNIPRGELAQEKNKGGDQYPQKETYAEPRRRPGAPTSPIPACVTWDWS